MQDPALTPSMISTPPTASPRPQALDPAAVHRQAARLARAPEPPWLHPMVAQRMAERLAFIKRKPRTVLDVSAWLGGSEAALRAALPDATQLWTAEQPQLAARARAELDAPWWRVWGRASRPRWLEAPMEPVSLLWSNLQFHVLGDLPSVLRRWHGCLETGGFLMLSCLGPDSFVELRRLHEAQGWGHAAPHWWDMHDIGDLVAQAGFIDPVMDQERLRLTWSSGEELLRDLRSLGGNLAPMRFPGLRTPRWKGALVEVLEALRGPDGRLGLTLELVYGHALRGEMTWAMARETTVSLEALRSQLKTGARSTGSD